MITNINANEDTIDLSELIDTLPPIVPRHKIEDYLPGIISKRYLQNLDAAGKGPRKISIGRKIAYLREDLIKWLIARIKLQNEWGRK